MVSEASAERTSKVYANARVCCLVGTLTEATLILTPNGVRSTCLRCGKVTERLTQVPGVELTSPYMVKWPSHSR